jgi:hydrogenase maturation factor
MEKKEMKKVNMVGVYTIINSEFLNQEKSRGDEQIWVIIHMYMGMSQ